jgi:hypothetical protein
VVRFVTAIQEIERFTPGMADVEPEPGVTTHRTTDPIALAKVLNCNALWAWPDLQGIALISHKHSSATQTSRRRYLSQLVKPGVELWVSHAK